MDYLICVEQYLKEQGLNIEVIGKIKSSIIIQRVPQGITLVEMGEQSNKLYFIIKGLVRGFYIDEEGNEVTKCFSEEGSWCGVYSIISSKPSGHWIETLEECILAKIDSRDMESFITTYPECQKMYSKLWAEAFMFYQERSTSFQYQSAKQRYLVFKDRYGYLEKRIEQKYIASYLGITPSSLSRIRREL